MPDKNWSRLSSLQLGRYAEYYAKMEFTSYGFEVYTSEVDDHGVDFVAKHKGVFYEVQVKAVRNDSPVNIKPEKIEIKDTFLICYLRFEDGNLPKVYCFPATVWNEQSEVFKYRTYASDKKSKPEYTINYSRKNSHEMDKYLIAKLIKNLGA